MELLIDYREKKIIAHLDTIKDLKYTNTNLDIGDFQVIKTIKKKEIEHKLSFIIERKTIKDCLASIKDSRYNEQKLRIEAEINSNIEKYNYQNMLFMYILEGDIDKDCKNDKERNIVNGFIISNQLRDNIQIFKTSNTKDTTSFLYKLYQRLEKNHKDFFKIPSLKIQSKQLEDNKTIQTNNYKVTKINHPDNYNNKEEDIINSNNIEINDNINKDKNLKHVCINDKKQINDIILDNSNNLDNDILLNDEIKTTMKTILIDKGNKQEQIDYLAARIQKKKSDNLTPDMCQKLMLTHIPGISAQISTHILEHFKDIKSLFNFLRFEKDFIKCNDLEDVDCIEKEKADFYKEKLDILKNIELKTSTGKSRKLGPSIANKIIYYCC